MGGESKAPESILEKLDGKDRPSVCRLSRPPADFPIKVASSGSGRRVAEEVLDVLLPSRPAVAFDEVLRSPYPFTGVCMQRSLSARQRREERARPQGAKPAPKIP